MSKVIQRKKQSNSVYDRRSLAIDYKHLPSILKKGLRVLDVGCATGSITKDIANLVGASGKVIGIDHTKHMIDDGNDAYCETKKLELLHSDLYSYEPSEPFDLIVSARVIQWMENPINALLKIKSMLKPGGQISILDYNHERLEWVPQPPISMRNFYQSFLKWRADAGMNNAIGTDLPHLLSQIGFKNIEVVPSHEVYTPKREDFEERVKIWSEVASLKQIADEGYISEYNRLRAIDDYNNWVENEAQLMKMFLYDVRGTL
ncbi:methyltransferase domain-containing protein [Flammeovirga pacifica]|uniref:Methyltransferase n=1 Tax=Flammeovirga pacifica TaxID=915059 RepID=A0A1S1YV14_FLAPC|nr:methyltransferase domain-containing protein [Flammeovirga pacifica]OHX64665.1 methyltransferase [Flammeovirga pacifica]